MKKRHFSETAVDTALPVYRCSIPSMTDQCITYCNRILRNLVGSPAWRVAGVHVSK
jgi:hypothetical protein